MQGNGGAKRALLADAELSHRSPTFLAGCVNEARLVREAGQKASRSRTQVSRNRPKSTQGRDIVVLLAGSTALGLNPSTG